jgi:hypothetical protein
MTHIAREKISATDDEIEAAFDDLGYGLTVDDLSFGPADEIENFRRDRREWSDPGRVVEDEPERLVIERAQAVRGQPRRDIALIRFGDYVAIMGMDR